MPPNSHPRNAQEPLFGSKQEIKEMAGAWAESGSLPTVYFVQFEWTERHALSRQSIKSTGPKSPASQPIRYTPRFRLSRPALSSPFPRWQASLNSRHPHASHREPTRGSHFPPSSFPLAGPPPAPKALSPAARAEKCRMLSEAKTPAPSPPWASGLTPGAQATRSALSSRPLPSR